MNDVTTAKAIKSWDELRKFLVELTFFIFTALLFGGFLPPSFNKVSTFVG